MPSPTDKKRLIPADELCKAGDISANQLDDYVGRGLIKIASRDGRKRMFAEPPSLAVLAAVKRYLDDHGNLHKALRELRGVFPDYYREEN